MKTEEPDYNYGQLYTNLNLLETILGRRKIATTIQFDPEPGEKGQNTKELYETASSSDADAIILTGTILKDPINSTLSEAENIHDIVKKKLIVAVAHPSYMPVELYEKLFDRRSPLANCLMVYQVYNSKDRKHILGLHDELTVSRTK